MSRWAEMFIALSGGADTVDTLRHNSEPASTVSHSVQSVTSPPEPAAAPPSPLDRAIAAWGEAEQERAAIIEHDGKIPREWAEGFARLDPDRPPGDVPLKRWQQFVDDVGGFLDGGWAEKATALGWGPLDLFGCDRDRPFARIDRAGLLWLLNGGKLVALAENTAAIEMPTGARQTYRRKPTEPGRVLAWELAPWPAWTCAPGEIRAQRSPGEVSVRVLRLHPLDNRGWPSLDITP